MQNSQYYIFPGAPDILTPTQGHPDLASCYQEHHRTGTWPKDLPPQKWQLQKRCISFLEEFRSVCQMSPLYFVKPKHLQVIDIPNCGGHTELQC